MYYIICMMILSMSSLKVLKPVVIQLQLLLVCLNHARITLASLWMCTLDGQVKYMTHVFLLYRKKVSGIDIPLVILGGGGASLSSSIMADEGFSRKW